MGELGYTCMFFLRGCTIFKHLQNYSKLIQYMYNFCLQMSLEVLFSIFPKQLKIFAPKKIARYTLIVHTAIGSSECFFYGESNGSDECGGR